MLELWVRSTSRRRRWSSREARLICWLIAVAAIVPRFAVLLHERDRILTSFTDKSDDFALAFVHHGTFGLVPGEPSAYTQPLYGFFLVPIYWIFGRNWWSVGFAQILVARARHSSSTPSVRVCSRARPGRSPPSSPR